MLVPVGAVVLFVVLYQLLRWALLRRVGDAMAHPGERRALGMVAAAIGALAGSRNCWAPTSPRTLLPPPVIQTYARQARLLAAALGRPTTLPPSPAMNSDLSLVRGRMSS